MKQPNWMRLLTILLVILASYAILFLTVSLLLRFAQAILLFVLGAMVAYVLTPMVNSLARLLPTRWMAIVLSYVLLAATLFVVAVLLFTPFVQQSQSLVDNLRNPSSASLRTISVLQAQTNRVRSDLSGYLPLVRSSGSLSSATVSRLSAEIRRVQVDIDNVRRGTLSGLARGQYEKGTQAGNRLPPNPPPQTQIPPSYVDPLTRQLQQLSAAFTSATRSPSEIDPVAYVLVVKRAKTLSSSASHLYGIISTNPIALIRSQTWLDEHGIKVNVQEKFGQAAAQFSNQGSNLLNNVITIVTETANILLNTALILIIAFYFLNDAGRLIHGGVNLTPARYREQVWFFISSLDRVIGGYIRGQLFLSGLAGVLAGGGAAILGVPYPLLIGIMTFLLESIPVIGPMIAVVPAAAISLFFTPPLTTGVFVLWFIIFQQIVTNVIGPRVNSMAVGIHPLEAILAVLVGYPLGGLLGAFLAVPLAGIVHIVVRELYAYLVLGHSLPTAELPPAPSAEDEPSEPPTPTMLGGRAVGS